MTDVTLPTPTPGASGEIAFDTAVKTFIDESGANGAKVGRRLQVSDGGLWVSTTGSDSNDGLTGGAAKLTVQAAINALPAGGGKINLLQGTFTSGVITPVSGLHLVGQGPGTILKITNGTNPVAFIYKAYNLAQTDNVYIGHLAIDGNKANNTTGIGIAISGDDVVVDSVKIYETAEAGVALGRPSGARNMRVLNSTVHNAGLSGNFWGAFAFTGGDNLVFEGCIATSDDGFMNYGFDLEPNAPDWEIHTAKIKNCISIGGQIIANGEAAGAVLEDVDIQGCTADGRLAAGVPAGVTVRDVIGRFSFKNNEVISPGHTSPAVWIKDVTDPQIAGNDLSGMGVDQATYADNVGLILEDVIGGSVTDNWIHAAAATHATAVAGIKQTGTTSGVQYGVNHFKNITVRGQDSEIVRARVKSGRWYATPSRQNAVAFGNGSMYPQPIWLPACTLDRLACEATVAGSTGSIVRLGIYNDDGQGRAGTLLLDAGTVVTTTSGVKTLTISQAVPAGLYWLVAVSQGAPSPNNPEMRGNFDPPPWIVDITASADGALGGHVALEQGGVTGALPATFAPTGSAASAHRVAVRVV